MKLSCIFGGKNKIKLKKGCDFMPRRARKTLSTSFFHVIVQGVNREYIFEKDTYKRKYLNLLKEAKKEYEIEIISYVIMSNHVHILIYTEQIAELSNFMKKVNEDYARYYNYIENRVGYLYRDRFLSEPISNQKYLLHCISYIHNNPVKANIVKKCEDYKYSSYNDFIRKNNFVSDKVLEVVFGTKKINIEEFVNLHNNQSYYFADYQNNIKENMQEIILDFENRYKQKWGDLIKNKMMLEKIIPEIKERIKISNYELARYLKIHRHSVERILLKNSRR